MEKSDFLNIEYLAQVWYSCYRWNSWLSWQKSAVYAWNVRNMVLSKIASSSRWVMDVPGVLEYVQYLIVQEKSRKSFLNFTDSDIYRFKVGKRVRARGLGAMTSPWHGEDREFNSLRAHQCSHFMISTFLIFI